MPRSGLSHAKRGKFKRKKVKGKKRKEENIKIEAKENKTRPIKPSTP